MRNEMYEISKDVYKQKYPFTQFPKEPSRAYRQSIIRTCLEMAYEEVPQRDGIVETIKRPMASTTAFDRDKNLITLPTDPLDVIVMPEFRRPSFCNDCIRPNSSGLGGQCLLSSVL